jgi:hypothetical protein
MPRKIHREDTAVVAAARKRLDAACIQVAKVLDEGERDPRWAESQELEAAAIELGRLLRTAPQAAAVDIFAGPVNGSWPTKHESDCGALDGGSDGGGTCTCPMGNL